MCLGPDGRVYLSDLGAAKKLQVRLSTGPCDFGSFVRLSTFVGTPAAMAPVRLLSRHRVAGTSGVGSSGAAIQSSRWR